MPVQLANCCYGCLVRLLFSDFLMLNFVRYVKQFPSLIECLIFLVAVVSLLQLSAPSPLDDSQIINDKSKVGPSCMMYSCELMCPVQGK